MQVEYGLSQGFAHPSVDEFAMDPRPSRTVFAKWNTGNTHPDVIGMTRPRNMGGSSGSGTTGSRDRRWHKEF